MDIEPTGDWRVILDLSFLRSSVAENAVLAVVTPPANHDVLVIEFGEHHLTLEGVRRDRLQEIQELHPWEADSQSRFAALFLAIEDLVQQRMPD